MYKTAVPLTLLLWSLTYAVATANDEAIQACMDCHGQDGVSTESDVPVIAGASAQYIIDSMVAYADGDRPATESKYRSGDTGRAPTDMAKIAKELDEDAIEEIANYFADKEFVPREQEFDAEKAAAGAKVHKRHCEKCHEDGGRSADDDAGILAGQWMPYMRQSFDEYASGDRTMPKKMKPKMEKLDEADIEALIHYYGSLQ
ncbi:MAG: c-type cytochrome [Gammaproteobacteria bacterium]|nr:c-type cytochrome [Gammaproteobacteria bacterium]